MAPGAGSESVPSGPLRPTYAAPLYTWFSPSRRDYHTTTDRSWFGAPGARHAPDYVFVRTEGAVWRADLEQPLDTVALHTWFHPTRREHRLVAGSADDAALRAAGYTHLRDEGFAPIDPLAGTLRLRAQFNEATGDHAVTTDPFFDATGYAAEAPIAFVLPDRDRGVSDAELARFGFGSMSVTGRRPLLVLLRHQVGSPVAAPRGLARYEDMAFDAGTSVQSFFHDNSGGLFTFERAGAIEVTLGEGAARTTASALGDASRAGFRFAPFDANGDRRVTAAELGVLVFDDDGSSCGQTMALGCFRPAGESVEVCVSGSFVGNAAGIATVAHELAHQLGAVDLYGPRALWNQRSTLMGGTCGVADSADLFHLDPWHKLAFGWARPRLLNASEPPTAYTIVEPRGGSSPVLLFDAARGPGEYYLAESRFRDTGNPFDATVADNGVALWHVALDERYVPRSVFFQDDADPELDHRLEVAVAHAPDAALHRGLPRFWTSALPRFDLSWPDRTPTGRSLLVAPRAPGERGADVEFGPDLRPRIDAPLPSAWASPGGEFVLEGVFGVRGRRVIALERAGAFIDVPVSRWSNERIVARVPEGTPHGAYRLSVYTGPDHAIRGNRVNVFVTSPGTDEIL